MFSVYVYCHMWCLLFGVLAHKGAEILGKTSHSVINKGSTKFKGLPYRIEQFVFSRANSQKAEHVHYASSSLANCRHVLFCDTFINLPTNSCTK